MAENIGRLTSKLILDNGVWKAKVEEVKKSATDLGKHIKNVSIKTRNDLNEFGGKKGGGYDDIKSQSNAAVMQRNAAMAAEKYAQGLRHQNMLLMEKARLERLAASAQAWGAEKSRLGMMQTTGAMNMLSDATAKNKKTMEDGAKKSELFANSIMGLRTTLLRLSIAWMAIQIIKKPFEWMKGALDELHDINDLATVLNDSTESISGLMSAARVEGIPVDKLQTSLYRLTKRLGEASDGSGDAKKAIEALGLSYEEILKKSPTEAFLDIADKVKDISSSYERGAISGMIFGRGMESMQELLLKGRSGLQGMIGDAKNMGVAFDESLTNKAEEASKRFNKLAESWRGFKTKFALFFSDTIEGSFGKLDELIFKLQHLNIAYQKGVYLGYSVSTLGILPLYNLLRHGETINDTWELFNKEEEQYRKERDARRYRKSGNTSGGNTNIDTESILQLQAQSEAREKILKDMASPYEKYLDRMKEIEFALGGTLSKGQINQAKVMGIDPDVLLGDEMYNKKKHAIDEAKKSYLEEIQAAEKYGVTLGNQSEAERKLYEEVKEKQQAIDDAKKSEEDEERALRKRDELVESLKTPWEKYNEKVQEYTDLLDDGLITQEQFSAAAQKSWNEMKSSVDALNKPMDDLFEKMQSDAASIWESTRTPLEKYTMEMGKLEKLYRAGFLDQETFWRAGTNAWEDLTKGAEGYSEAMRRMQQNIGKATAVRSLNEIRPSSRIGISGGTLNLNMNETNGLLRQIARNTSQPGYARVG